MKTEKNNNPEENKNEEVKQEGKQTTWSTQQIWLGGEGGDV